MSTAETQGQPEQEVLPPTHPTRPGEIESGAAAISAFDNGPSQDSESEPQVIEPNPPPAGSAAKAIALTEAAKTVPATRQGAMPETLEHQVTYAQYMAKAITALPDHLRGNVGDCLAIIDIASRAGLSPYMMANKTYKTPNGRLAFESQLYHALLIQSGYIQDTAMHVSYEGAGMERTCTVWATLKGERDPRRYTSPPLSELHPGTTKKIKDGVEHVYSKGSPLWVKKPDVQMFYDTTRDWGRMFCPIATLGILDAYETQETPIGSQQISEAPTGEGLRRRLQSADRGEGHQPGGAVDELSRVANEANSTIKPADDKTTAEPDKTKGKAARAPGKGHAASPSPAANKAKKKSDPPRATTLSNPKNAATKSEASAAADRAQARSDAKRQQQQETDTPKSVPTKPKSSAEYQVYCIDWIGKASDPEAALGRWEQERNMRDDCTVPVKMRNDLRERLEKKHGV